MKNQIFADYTPMDRIRILEDTAVDVHEGYDYDRLLTEDEISEQEKLFAQQHVEIEKLEMKKADFLAEINAQIKGKKTYATKVLKTIRTGRDPVTEKVFIIRDETEWKEGVYNMHGQLLKETNIPQKDRQHTIAYKAAM